MSLETGRVASRVLAHIEPSRCMNTYIPQPEAGFVGDCRRRGARAHLSRRHQLASNSGVSAAGLHG
jgi:hypothetical protein